MSTPIIIFTSGNPVIVAVTPLFYMIYDYSQRLYNKTAKKSIDKRKDMSKNRAYYNIRAIYDKI